MSRIVSASITAENQFTDSIKLSGPFDLSISGTFSATVTVQRSYDNSSWKDVDTFTVPTEQYGYQPEIAWYRAGVKTGGFTSGTAVVSVAGNSGIDYTPTR
jgi:hypothetical protein